MVSILEGELAEEISAGLLGADIPVDVVVTRLEESGPPHDPTITPVPYAAKGFTESYDNLLVAAGAVQATDVKVMVLSTSLAIDPTPADTVTVGGTSYSIISVKTDPAGAIWELQARA